MIDFLVNFPLDLWSKDQTSWHLIWQAVVYFILLIARHDVISLTCVNFPLWSVSSHRSVLTCEFPVRGFQTTWQVTCVRFHRYSEIEKVLIFDSSSRDGFQVAAYYSLQISKWTSDLRLKLISSSSILNIFLCLFFERSLMHLNSALPRPAELKKNWSVLTNYSAN